MGWMDSQDGRMTTRHAKRRECILAGGGSQLAILLNKDATDALSAIQAATGETKTQVIERLLLLGSDSRYDRKDERAD